MKKIAALVLSGLAIMFVRIDLAGPPAPAASAGEVLFREGDAVSAPAPEPVEPPKEIAQAVPVDVKQLESAAQAIEAQVPAAYDYGCDTYRIRIRGYLTTTGEARFRNATAVSLGGGKFLATKHDFDGLRPGYVVEVEIGTDWHKSTDLRLEPAKDLATVSIAKADVSGVTVRKAEFGERVTLYGLTTCKAMRGTFFADVVGLEAAEPGVEGGDSGGGVYGDDGALIALVRGHGVDRRSVVVVTAVPDPVEAPKASALPTPAAQSIQVSTQSAQAVQGCPGGVCPRPAYTQPSTRRGRRH